MGIRGYQKGTLFDGDNIATKIYSYSNWVSSRYDSVAAQIAVATLTASWITLRIEGRYDSNSRTASIYCNRYTSTTSIDQIANVVVDYPEIRAGAIASPVTATPNNLYVSLVLADVR